MNQRIFIYSFCKLKSIQNKYIYYDDYSVQINNTIIK